MGTALSLESQVLLPPQEVLYEILNGQRVELPPMSAYASFLAFQLASAVNQYSQAHELGLAVAEMLFHFPLPRDRNRRPDGAFVSYRRWPKGKPLPAQDNAWQVVPELAIEVVSPTDGVQELLERIDEYFRAGVQVVWVVFPTLKLVYLYQSMTNIRVLTEKDELDGGQIVPGFRLGLANLFQDESKA